MIKENSKLFMEDSSMRIKNLCFVLFSLFTCNVMAVELIIPDDKAVILFDTKLGIVTFAHQKHAELSITECTLCHHKIQPEDTAVKPCHDCHKHDAKTKDVLKTSKAFHTRCIGCHEYTAAGGQNAGPLKKKCKLCHVKPETK